MVPSSSSVSAPNGVDVSKTINVNAKKSKKQEERNRNKTRSDTWQIAKSLEKSFDIANEQQRQPNGWIRRNISLDGWFLAQVHFMCTSHK